MKYLLVALCLSTSPLLAMEEGLEEKSREERLQEALTLGDSKTVFALVSTPKEKVKAFRVACLNGYLELAKELYTDDMLDSTDSCKRTALMLASAAGRTEVVRFLLSKNPKLDCQEATGLTALMFACATDRYYVVELLLKAGADVAVYTPAHEGAIHFSVRAEDTRIIPLLLKYNAVKKQAAIYAKALLDYAKDYDNDKAIELLTKALE